MGTDPRPADGSLDGPEVDQVAAAQDWLRSHGVDPAGLEQAPRPRSVGAGPGASTESGYSRSRRAGSPAAAGRLVSRRRPRSQEPDDRAEPAAGASTADPDADPEGVAREIVLRKLAVQARTRVELERALQARDVPEDAAGAVLDRMDELGLVDDATFAHDWVASRQQRRHLSKTALRRELQTKGVDRDLIDDALADVDGADEHEAALDLARRRSASMGGLTREVAYRRLGGVLARRGFSSSTTTRVLAEVLDHQAED